MIQLPKCPESLPVDNENSNPAGKSFCFSFRCTGT